MKEIVPEYEFSEEQLNLADALAAETGLEKTTAHILFARGVDTAEKVRRFMNPGKANFLSPFLMRGMKELADQKYQIHGSDAASLIDAIKRVYYSDEAVREMTEDMNERVKEYPLLPEYTQKVIGIYEELTGRR